jgi:hypothetical protein
MASVVARSDGSPFQDLMTGEFSSAARSHGIRVQSAPGGDGVYSPGSSGSAGAQTLQQNGGPQLQVSAELAPANLPGKSFAGEFTRRFHRPPGPYAAYGYEAMDLLLHSIGGAGNDASSFRDKVRNGVFGAHLDGTVLGSYAITDEGDTTECMVQRYRGTQPLGAPCP